MFPKMENVIKHIKINDNSKCWEWIAYLDKDGYGKITVKVNNKIKGWLAHRVIYILLKGEIPIGLQLDHLCKNKKCVNPDHLEPVTQLENIKRRLVYTCKNGHQYGHTGFRKNCIECQEISRRRPITLV